MPELLWKTYIDFEIAEGDYEKARKLYERLLQKTAHVKVTKPLTSFSLLNDFTFRFRCGSRMHISKAACLERETKVKLMSNASWQ